MKTNIDETCNKCEADISLPFDVKCGCKDDCPHSHITNEEFEYICKCCGNETKNKGLCQDCLDSVPDVFPCAFCQENGEEEFMHPKSNIGYILIADDGTTYNCYDCQAEFERDFD